MFIYRMYSGDYMSQFLLIDNTMQRTKKSAVDGVTSSNANGQSLARKGNSRQTIITRKGPGANGGQRRAHSSHQLRMSKTSENFSMDLHQHQNGQVVDKVALRTGTLRFMRVDPAPTNDRMVFGRFSDNERDYAGECLSSVRSSLVQNGLLSGGIEQAVWQLESYLNSLEDNNTKLLEVNHFFQKEFNLMITQQASYKNNAKCARQYCLQCRYHIQKENKWKQERVTMQRQLDRLRQGVSVRTSTVRESLNGSRCDSKRGTGLEIQLRKEVQELEDELDVKDKEYMVLLNEFNYLDDINRQLKNKVTVTLQEYRYLSIQNRTLLNIKAQLGQRENQCRRFKQQRDTFKRKLILLHRQHQQLIEQRDEQEEERAVGGRVHLMAPRGMVKPGRPPGNSPSSRRGGSPASRSNSPRRGFPQEESLFSLSSLSSQHDHSIDHSSPI